MKKFLSKWWWLMCFKLVYASDTVNIDGLNTVISSGQQMIKVFAKWGGLAMIVFTGVMIGMHKAKGEIAGVLTWAGLGCGLIIAAFGWWNTIFTSGFTW